MASGLSRSRVAAWVAAGVLVGGVGGVVISQLGTATAASPSPRPSAGGDWIPGGPMAGPGMPADGAGRVLHGEMTVRTPNDGTRVIHVQNGVITAVGGSTVTVRSSDGFTATYQVDKTTRITVDGSDGALSTLKKDDTVHVMAVENGSTTVAKAIFSGDLRRGLGFGHHLRPGMHRGLMMGRAG